MSSNETKFQRRTINKEVTFGEIPSGTFYKSISGDNIYMKLNPDTYVVEDDEKFIATSVGIGHLHHSGTFYNHNGTMLVEVVQNIIFEL